MGTPPYLQGEHLIAFLRGNNCEMVEEVPLRLGLWVLLTLQLVTLNLQQHIREGLKHSCPHWLYLGISDAGLLLPVG